MENLACNIFFWTRSEQCFLFAVRLRTLSGGGRSQRESPQQAQIGGGAPAVDRTRGVCAAHAARRRRGARVAAPRTIQQQRRRRKAQIAAALRHRQ